MVCASRFVLFYLMLRNSCLACLKASVLGPILSFIKCTPLNKVIQNHSGIRFHAKAVDMQLYVHLTQRNVAQAFDRLKNCLDDITKRLCENKLKTNPDKTEFFGS